MVAEAERKIHCVQVVCVDLELLRVTFELSSPRFDSSSPGQDKTMHTIFGDAKPTRGRSLLYASL